MYPAVCLEFRFTREVNRAARMCKVRPIETNQISVYWRQTCGKWNPTDCDRQLQLFYWAQQKSIYAVRLLTLMEIWPTGHVLYGYIVLMATRDHVVLDTFSVLKRWAALVFNGPKYQYLLKEWEQTVINKEGTITDAPTPYCTTRYQQSTENRLFKSNRLFHAKLHCRFFQPNTLRARFT